MWEGLDEETTSMVIRGRHISNIVMNSRFPRSEMNIYLENIFSI